MIEFQLLANIVDDTAGHEPPKSLGKASTGQKLQNRARTKNIFLNLLSVAWQAQHVDNIL